MSGKRLNPFQHALARPDTYIGSVKTINRECWVYESAIDAIEGGGSEASNGGKAKNRIIKKMIKYNPGLERIFVEVKSNVEDNKWRSEKKGLQMKKIEVTFNTDPDDDDFGEITILNDGYFISAEKSTYKYEDYRSGKTIEEELYPAEVFFGEMLAGTNFDDGDEERKTSGRNGMGAKATNIFSTRFTVEHFDPTLKLVFKQVYTDHGRTRSTPTLTSSKNKNGYTKISFIPDYEYFGYPGLDDDLTALFRRHLVDCSMITGIPVTLNGEKLSVKNLESYAKLYFPSNNLLSFTSKFGDECVIVEGDIPTVNAMNEVAHVSFINGIYTKDGGLHVDAWSEKIFRFLVQEFNNRKPKKGEKEALKATGKQMYPYFVIFIRAEISKPTFDSQTKDRLNGPEFKLCDAKDAKEFNEEIREKIVTKMLKWDFVELLEEKLSFEQDSSRSKKERVNKNLALGKKASDANEAGKKKAMDCTLYITEGLSAKAFAETLTSKQENGSDYFGSLALKGKFINVQNATFSEINENLEVQLFKQLLGLIFGVDYSTVASRKTLRYGRVCILTDADDDGIHIQGLVLNFFYKYWPSLFVPLDEPISEKFKQRTFVCSLSTAVTTVSKKGGKKNDVTMYYSNPSFRKWFDNLESTKGYEIKYFKGLGTHKPGDHERYLKDLKIVEYTLDGNEPDMMDLGFNKDMSHDRKSWITHGMKEPGTINLEEDLYKEFAIEGELPLSLFVDDKLIIYHRMVLRRAIPCLYDSFKEGQRKIFYGITHDADAKKGTVGVENLTGSIKKLTGYHHGADSLEGGIKNMAMGFVGSNNIPLLVNAGEFGTRVRGGKDAAAARYIETRCEDITDILFSSADEPLYENNVEDNKPVEYKYYMPIMPLILINGADGIASGFSSNIPCYNPDDLLAWIVEWLTDRKAPGTGGAVDKLAPLKPWYKGYKGEIELVKPKNSDKYTGWISKGILEEEFTTLKNGKTKPTGWWVIKECPIGYWTEDLKIYIEKMAGKVSLEAPKKKTSKAKKEPKKEVKLEKCLNDEKRGTCPLNEVLWYIQPTADFTPDINVPKNFKILQKKYSLTNMVVIDENDYPRRYDSAEALLHDWCVKRFEYYGLRKSYWMNFYIKELIQEKNRYEFVKAVQEGNLNMQQDDELIESDMIAMGLEKVDESFNYLLSMQMRSMTLRKMNDILEEIEKIQTKLDVITKHTKESLWKEDLASFKVGYAKFLKTRKEN